VRIPSTVRDPKILAQRRAELVEVATNLFLERGFHKTSIRDIARACPFNLAALYMYVSSKEDILYLVAQHLVSEIVAALEPVASTTLDPADALVDAYKTYCKVVDRYSRHIRLLYSELESLSKDARDPILKSMEALIEIFEKLVKRAIEAQEVSEVDTRLAALDLLVTAHMWAIHGRLLRGRLDLDAFAHEQCAILFRGLLRRPRNATDARRASARNSNGKARKIVARTKGAERSGRIRGDAS